MEIEFSGLSIRRSLRSSGVWLMLNRLVEKATKSDGYLKEYINQGISVDTHVF
jgi:hypothetical protein